MSLKQREQRFNKLCECFPCRQPGKLIAIYRIPKAQFSRLQSSTLHLLSRCLQNKEDTPIEETNILDRISTNYEAIDNITPNGQIRPRRQLTLEYNLWLKTVIDIIVNMGIGNIFTSFGLPSLRYKSGCFDRTFTDRSYATEKPHLETWVGHKDTVGLYVPILGNICTNYVEFSPPPDNFTEDWAIPMEDFSKGDHIASQYHKLTFDRQLRDLYVFEDIVLHSSKLDEPISDRISLDMMCVCSDQLTGDTASRPGDLRFSLETLSKIGKSKILTFEDKITPRLQIREILDF